MAEKMVETQLQVKNRMISYDNVELIEKLGGIKNNTQTPSLNVQRKITSMWENIQNQTLEA